MSKTKEYFMRNDPQYKFEDLEREYLFNDILAQEDSSGYEKFKNSPDYNESDIVKKAKLEIGNAREIRVGAIKNQEELVPHSDNAGPWS